jgi:hypothetical protein
MRYNEFVRWGIAMGEKASLVFPVRCACGNEGPINVRSFGRPFTCGGCRARVVPVWGIAPKSKQAVSITLQASGDSFKLPAGMYELACPCGQKLYAYPRQAGKRVQCPVCDIWMKLEHSKDPQTLETRIRVVKSRLNQLPTLPPPPPAAAVQFILCSCGESIPVETSGSETEVRCQACSTRIRLEINQDSVSSVIVVDPGNSSSAPAAEKRGIDEALSLDDFH